MTEDTWRPIETAPDRTLVLLYVQQDGEPYVTVGTNLGGCWYSNYTCDSIEHGAPTHWQPLPPPPATPKDHP